MTMTELAHATLTEVQTVLDADGWTVARTDDDSQIFFRVASDDDSWNVLITVTDDLRLVVISFILTAPERDLSDLDWLVGRLNFSMILGRFEVDDSDQEVRFVTSIGVDGVDITPSLVREVCYPNFATVERHLPALRQLGTDADVREIVASLAT